MKNPASWPSLIPLLAILVIAAAHPASAQVGPIYPGDEISSWTFTHPPIKQTEPVFGTTRTFHDETSRDRLGITLYAAGKNPVGDFIGEKMQAVESLYADFDLAAESLLAGVPRNWLVGEESGPPYSTRLAAQISGEFELTGFLTVIGDSEADLKVSVELLDCGPSPGNCDSASVVAGEVIGTYAAVGSATVATGGGADMSVGSITGGVGGGGIDFDYGVDLLTDLITDTLSFDMQMIVKRGHKYRIKVSMKAEIRTGDRGGVGMVFTHFDPAGMMEDLLRPKSPLTGTVWADAMPDLLQAFSLLGLDKAIEDFSPLTMELPPISFDIAGQNFNIPGQNADLVNCGSNPNICPDWQVGIGLVTSTLDLPPTNLSMPDPAFLFAANDHCTAAGVPDPCCSGDRTGTCNPFEVKAQSILDQLGLPSDLAKLMTGFDSTVLKDPRTGDPLHIEGVLAEADVWGITDALVELPGLKVNELTFLVEYDLIELLDLATAAVQQQAFDNRVFLTDLIESTVAEIQERITEVEGEVFEVQEIEIEKALLDHTVIPNFFLPNANGGRLEDVRDLVLLQIGEAQLAGLDVSSALAYFQKAESHLVDLEYLESYEDLARSFGVLSQYQLRQPDIEQALANHETLPSLYLPEEFGGRLELVRLVVEAWLLRAEAAGLRVQPAWKEFEGGEDAFEAGDYPEAYQQYGQAYRKINEHVGGGRN